MENLQGPLSSLEDYVGNGIASQALGSSVQSLNNGFLSIGNNGMCSADSTVGEGKKIVSRSGSLHEKYNAGKPFTDLRLLSRAKNFFPS